jgi:hypothetical protein
MKKLLLVILCLLLVLIIGVVVGGLMLDKNYELSRSIVIDASPKEIHKFVGDLKMWDQWTPWKDHDDSLEVKLEKQTSGVGARQTWSSKDGDGELIFTKWDKSTGVEYDMAFIAEGEKLPSTGAITYEEIGKKTKVTWSMKGEIPLPVMGGWYALTMEPVVGPYFDEGLAKLKDRIEKK